MNAEIIAVGTELLLGDIINTNAQYLSKELAALGISCHYQVTVGDNKNRLKRAITQALQRSNIIIFTGGLGPTEDDLTKETICEAILVPLELHEESLKRIEDFFKRLGRTMTESNKKQAMLPVGCTVFENDNGTAPGCAIERGNQCVIMLPGPPREMTKMFEGKVRSFLKKYSQGVIFSANVHVMGIGESSVEEKMKDLINQSNPTVALYAKEGEVLIRVSSFNEDKAAAQRAIRPVIEDLRGRLGENIYGIDAKNIQQAVVDRLKKHRLKIATAESCTAGTISQMLTEVSGSSEVFEMGVSAYSGRIKTAVLGVDAKLIAEKGEVSSEVAAAMAKGVLDKSGADIGVGITGLAGPGGGTKEKPVGLVYAAICDKKHCYVKKMMLGHETGDERDYIRLVSAKNVLDMVRRYLEHYPNDLEGFVIDNGHKMDVSAVASAAEAGGKSHGMLGESAKPNLKSNFDPDEHLHGSKKEKKKEKLDIAEEKQEDGSLAEGKADLTEESAEQSPKKKSKFKAILAYLFPEKGDKPKEVARKIIFLISVVVLIVSSCYLADYFYESYRTWKINEDNKNLYPASSQASNIDSSDISSQIGSSSDISKYPKGMLPAFYALYDKNPETVGYIRIEDTDIDFPVVQSEDNDYYLHYDFTGTANDHGSIFVDYRTNAKEINDVTVVYGHNMQDGQMFGKLIAYKKLDYYKEHPMISFDTIYEEAQWKIFSVFYANTLPEFGEIFYYNNTINFDSDDAFMNYVTQLKIRSVFDTGVDINEEDQLLLLSTCDYDIYEGRFVVVARKVREGESAEVDTAKAVKAENPLMPDIWYETFGGTKPNYSSDGTLIASTGSNIDSLNANSGTVISANSSLTEPSQTVIDSVSSAASSTAPSVSSQAVSSAVSSQAPSSSSSDNGGNTVAEQELTVTINGETGTYDAYELLCKVVAAEMGDPFDEEAIKAQTIAAHTYILYYNTYYPTSPPSVSTKTPSSKIKNAVAEVIDEIIYYNDKLAMPVYHSISGGKTVDSKDVWGANFSYLVSVDSYVDAEVASAYKRTVTYSEDQMVSIILDKMNIDLEDCGLDPEDWFEVLSFTSGDYNGKMSVGGYTTYKASRSGGTTTITGRVLREKVLGLRSACFDISYSDGVFTIDTYGYGHGVGMSQHGANQYSLLGYDYEWILTHYYTGIEIK